MNSQNNGKIIEKMFNAVERPIKELITTFIGVERQCLFDEAPIPEPIVLENKNKKGSLLVINLSSGNSKCEYDLTKHKNEKFLNDVLDFYKYSVNQVYGSIVKTIDDEKVRHHLSNHLFVWDGYGNFNITYHDEIEQNLRMVQQQLGINLQKKKELTSNPSPSYEDQEELKKIDIEFKELFNKLNKYQNLSKTKEHLKKIKTATDALKNAPILRLVFTEMSKKTFISHNSHLPVAGKSIFD